MQSQTGLRRPKANPSSAASGAHAAAELRRAVALHQAGALDEAERAYRSVLRQLPRQADALHLLGVIHHQRGESRKAVELIRRAIKIDGSNAHALINLGAALHALDRLDQAEAAYRRAQATLPDNAELNANLAAIRQAGGDRREAIDLLQKAISQAPRRAPWLARLGDLLFDEERYEAAAEVLRDYLALSPDDVKARNNYGVALEKLNRFAEAAEQFRRVTAVSPDLAEGHANLGNALAALHKVEEAEACYRRAIALAPENWRFRGSLANFLLEIGRVDEGRALYDAVLGEQPDEASLRSELGARLVRARRLPEAVEQFRAAIAIDPNFAAAHNNLGNALTELQRWDEALPSFREFIRLNPASVLPRINLCQLLQRTHCWDEAVAQAYGLRLSPGYQPELCDGRILQVLRDVCDFDGLEAMTGVWDLAERLPREELASWALTLMAMTDDEPRLRRFVALMRRLGAQFTQAAALNPLAPPPARPGAAGRKLRLGFLSSDFRTHSVAKFILPVFRHFNRDRFAVYCYSAFPGAADAVQNEVRSLVDGFRVVYGRTDREAAQAIRDDDIDILFDLNGYTALSRVSIMAYRPAPVQAAWIGWPATTGIAAMDYVVVDRFSRPAGDEYMSEKPLELSGAFLCFESFPEEPIGPLPCERNGHITFGTLNGVYKYSRPMIALWADVMRRVEGSRMVIVRPEAASLVFLNNLVQEFERNGIARQRLDIINNRNGTAGHFSYYNKFDISLDTFPVTGGTTTADALWMGVPVVSRMGPAYHQRVGGAIQKHCGLDDLCVETPEEFVQVATALAGDRARLRALRQGLRATLRDSALCRADKFMVGFEDAMQALAERHFG